VSRLLLALVAAAFLAAAPASAQGVVGTQANPVQVPPQALELELQQALTGGRIAGRVSIPDQQAANLIQPAGQSWRDFHNVTLTWVGGIAILGILAVLVLFYAVRGRIPIEGGPAGRTIERFNLLDRAVHWMTASTFVILALSGLNLTFGRFLILPLIGPEAFAALSLWGKIAHNFLAFPFTLGIVLMLLLWVKDNIPNGRDVAWFAAGGGLVGKGRHPPAAGRFNGGQKMVFWLTVLGGAAVAVSGYVLVFPFAFTDIAGQQLSHIVHGVLSVVMIAAIMAHIYIGSIGMEGAFDAMGSGQVDLNWAREHHALWVEQETARGRGAAPPAGAAAAGD
jgi:formate dehydrogenase subunit gamma